MTIDSATAPSRGGADEQTIFAVASGAGRAAVAIMRVSGPDCAAILRVMCGAVPPARQAALRKLCSPNGELLDHALVLWFPGPGSYTGEDLLELQVHGSRAVVKSVAEALVDLGARPAQPGEFTRRGFLNGKMDLVEAEAIADLVDAETDAQRLQALHQLGGALSELYQNWGKRIRHALAWQEALIDFVTEDLPVDVERELLQEVQALHADISQHLDDRGRGENVRTGLTFVIAGRPNVGKSTLINALAQSEVAIVAPTAGTTRDVIEVRVDLGGILVTLVDTAGIRRSGDAVEVEGIRRAQERIDKANLVVLVQDAFDPKQYEPIAIQGPCLLVLNKIDIGFDSNIDAIKVSARTGAGISALRDELTRRAIAFAEAGDSAPLTRVRHRAALQDTSRALAAASTAPYADLRAEELRVALQTVGQITGEIRVDELLDTIFGQFCIGK